MPAKRYTRKDQRTPYPMKPEYSYRLNCGQYVLHRGDTPIGAVMDEVSLAIDLSTGGLLKHGPAAAVQAHVNHARAKLRPVNQEWADALVVVTGRIPLDELNKCLTNSGYAGLLWQKMKAGELSPQPLV